MSKIRWKPPQHVADFLREHGVEHTYELRKRHVALRINGRVAIHLPLTPSRDTGRQIPNNLADLRRAIRKNEP